MQNLVYLKEETGARVGTTLDQVRRAVWAMLYADDAGVVSKSADGLARMMTIIVEVFREFGLMVSGEENGDPCDARKGEPAVTTAAAAADRRSSGAEVRTDDRVPILGWPRQRAW